LDKYKLQCCYRYIIKATFDDEYILNPNVTASLSKSLEEVHIRFIPLNPVSTSIISLPILILIGFGIVLSLFSFGILTDTHSTLFLPDLSFSIDLASLSQLFKLVLLTVHSFAKSFGLIFSLNSF
jgi:hypothetical protein